MIPTPAALAAALLFPPTAFDLITAAEIGSVAVAPDGNSIVFAWTRLGDADLWVLPLPDGEPRLLVAEPGDEDDPHFSPDGRSIAFVGEGRDGNADVFVVRLADGTTRNLTDHPARDLAPRWAADGARLAFLSDRGGSGGDLYEVDAGTADPGVGTPSRRSRGGGLREHDVHASGFWVTRAKVSRRGASEEIRFLPLTGGRGTRVARGLFTIGLPTRSPDGSRFALSALRGSRRAIAVLPSHGRGVEWLSSDEDADHLTPRYSPRGDALAYVRRSDDASQLVVRLLDGSGVIPLSPVDGSIGAYAWLQDGSALVYTHSHSALPRSLFMAGLQGRPARLLVDAAPSLANAELRRARRVLIPRPHAPRLRAWVVDPKPERAGRGIVLVRDGSRSAPDAFAPSVQFFASLRYAVVILDVDEAPSRRGGASGARGEDVLLAANWLVHEALAAPGRIGVVGEGPLGGHVALAATAAAPDHLRAAVSIGGAADFASLLPLAAKLEAVMWVYGAEDPLLGSAQRFRAEMLARGAQTPACLYAGEGAPLRGRRSRAHALEQMADFLMKRL